MENHALVLEPRPASYVPNRWSTARSRGLPGIMPQVRHKAHWDQLTVYQATQPHGKTGLGSSGRRRGSPTD